MKSVFGLFKIVNFVLLLILLAKFSSAAPKHDKVRREANMGLYPYARVGRSDPSLKNNLQDADAAAYESIYGFGDASAEDLDDYQRGVNSMHIPHVAHNTPDLRKWAHFLALQQALEKRNEPIESSGLWFGPRLGKRSVNVKDYAAVIKGQKELH